MPPWPNLKTRVVLSDMAIVEKHLPARSHQKPPFFFCDGKKVETTLGERNQQKGGGVTKRMKEK